jgi:hypothetical protein
MKNTITREEWRSRLRGAKIKMHNRARKAKQTDEPIEPQQLLQESFAELLSSLGYGCVISHTFNPTRTCIKVSDIEFKLTIERMKTNQ